MSRKYWVVMTGPKRTISNFFRTRQEAVEFANRYYDKTGDVVEVKDRILGAGREEPKWHK